MRAACAVIAALALRAIVRGEVALAQSAITVDGGFPSRSDYVLIGYRWVHKACVKELPSNGAHISSTTITDDNGHVTPIATCPYPDFPSSFAGWADGPGLSAYGAVEWTEWTNPNPTSEPLDFLYGTVTVPDQPPPDGGFAIAWWNGFGNQSTGAVIQPILIYGNPDAGNLGVAQESSWVIAAYYYPGSGNEAYYYGSMGTTIVQPGDTVEMEVYLNEYSPGNYEYIAEVDDTTQGYWWYLSLDVNISDVPFAVANLGALEVENFTNCTQLSPNSDGVTFSNIELYVDNGGGIVPEPNNWATVDQYGYIPGLPNCGWYPDFTTNSNGWDSVQLWAYP